MSDQKPSLDVRPYAVYDALSPEENPRVVVQTTPAAAVAHVVSSRFSATALNAMELLALTARGARVEDPRGVLPAAAPPEPAQQPLMLDPPIDPYTRSRMFPEIGTPAAGNDASSSVGHSELHSTSVSYGAEGSDHV